MYIGVYRAEDVKAEGACERLVEDLKDLKWELREGFQKESARYHLRWMSRMGDWRYFNYRKEFAEG